MKHLVILAVIVFVSLITNAQTANRLINQDSGVKVKMICTTTITKNNMPLYVVDGKIADSVYTKNLDPKSIQSVNILKGDKAIKKYGKRGENGVIIITTKKDLLLQP